MPPSDVALRDRLRPLLRPCAEALLVGLAAYGSTWLLFEYHVLHTATFWIGVPVLTGAVAGIRAPGGRSNAVASAMLVPFVGGAAIVLYGGATIAFGAGIGWDGITAAMVWLFLAPLVVLLCGVGGLAGGLLRDVGGRRRTVPSSDADAASGAERMDVSLRTLASSTLAGAIAMYAVGIVGLFFFPLLPVVAPLAGGFIAGNRAESGLAVGALCGLAAGFVNGAGIVLVLFASLAEQETVAPGVGLGILLFLLLACLTVLFGGIGGLIGGMQRMQSADLPLLDGDTEES